MGGEAPEPMRGCRFNDGYATTVCGTLLELPPPVNPGRDLPAVFAFGRDQNERYHHFQVHARGTELGEDVIDQLRNSWPHAVRTVLEGRAVPGEEGHVPGTLVWILEDADNFLELFVTSKVMVFTRPCTFQSAPCKPACFRPERPQRLTIRSVQIWRPLRFLSYGRLSCYSNLGSETSWRFFVTGDHRGLAGKRFPVECPEDPESRYWSSKGGYVRKVHVTIRVDGELRSEEVPLNRGKDQETFRGDPVGFLRSHDVHYTHWTPKEVKRVFSPRSND